VEPDAIFGRAAGGQTALKANCPIIPNIVAYSTPGGGGGVTVDPSAGPLVRVTLTSDIALAANAGAEDGAPFQLEFKQDATGGRTVDLTTYFTNAAWAGGAPPTVTATANKLTIIVFRWDSALVKWLEVSRALNVG
jgi:hypothetical protein